VKLQCDHGDIKLIILCSIHLLLICGKKLEHQLHFCGDFD
jgi:hypothetical protein